MRRLLVQTRLATTKRREELVGLSGLEPPTSPLSGVRSNHLSYKPIKVFLLVTFYQTICVDTAQCVS